MSLPELKVDGLYIILFVRSPEYDPDNFHWVLYLHQGPVKGGMKYHIKGEGDGWVTDHAVTAGVFKSFLLVGLLHIANVPKGWEDRANSIITEDDNRLNSIPGNTCRVWLLSALERLRDAGVLHCSNLVALEREVKDWGNSHQISAIDAQTPRPCGVSNLCGPL